MADAETKRTVLIIITLDTKGDEARFLRERILEDGLNVVVLDSGILGEPRGGVIPDIPASEIARAAGTTLEELRKNLKEVIELCLEELDEPLEDLAVFVGVEEISVDAL